MDKLKDLYNIIYPILKEYADIPYHYGDLSTCAKLITHLKSTYKLCHSREGGNPGRFPPSRE